MRVVWKKEIIPKAWCSAEGVLILKEKESTDITQSHPISRSSEDDPLSGEKQPFNTTVQKTGIPGFLGHLKHTSMIWHHIQTAKREKNNLHVNFLETRLDLPPHSFLWASFNFRIPESVANLVKTYFQDLQLCFTMPDFTTIWRLA